METRETYTAGDSLAESVTGPRTFKAKTGHFATGEYKEVELIVVDNRYVKLGAVQGVPGAPDLHIEIPLPTGLWVCEWSFGAAQPTVTQQTAM